jgi:hypothetical protein
MHAMADAFDLLWPRPRRIQRLAGHCPGGAPSVHDAPELGPSAYRLELNSDGVGLLAGDDAGRRHGLATLARFGPAPWPAATIDDAPAHGVRGVMLDISRDRVPDTNHLQQLLAGVADLQGNHVQLYVEHTLAYAGHDPVWRDADALGLGEFAHLRQQAARLGIELAPCQNGLGHWERWLRHEAYAAFGEMPDVAARIAAGDESPYSLRPTDPAVLALLHELYGQLYDACPGGGVVNLGCDETADIGRGASAAAVAQRGLGPLWADHVRALAAQARARGFRPAVWADMALEYPSALEAVDHDTLLLAWWYEADGRGAPWLAASGGAPGTCDNHFRVWGQQYAARGQSWWACPGTAAWRGFTGRSTARSGSIAAACTAGAAGVLITEWGDCGHRHTWPLAWYGLTEGLGRAWNPEAAPDPAAIGAAAFGSPALGQWLDALGRCEDGLFVGATHPRRGGPLINNNPHFLGLHYAPASWLPDDSDWAELAQRLEHLGRSRPAVADALIGAECDHAVASAQAAVAVTRALRGHHRHDDARQQLHAVAREQARLWERRSRHGGLADSLRWWQRAAARLDEA